MKNPAVVALFNGEIFGVHSALNQIVAMPNAGLIAGIFGLRPRSPGQTMITLQCHLKGKSMFRISTEDLKLSAASAADEAIEAAAAIAQVRQPLKQIFFGWPNLRQVLNRCAALITHRYPLSPQFETAVLPHAIIGAVGAFASARNDMTNEAAAPSAFLGAILDASAGIAALDVYGAGGHGQSERWNATEQPLIDFAQHFKELVFLPVTPSREEVLGTRLVMMGRILSVADASLLDFRAAFEATPQDKRHVPRLRQRSPAGLRIVA